jgi:membrane protease YdiL (CAAX protease family)
MRSIKKGTVAPAEARQSLREGPAYCQLTESAAGDNSHHSFKTSVAGKALPRDLRVSWSWPHFVSFLCFCWLSITFVRFGTTILVRFLVSDRHLTIEDLQAMSTHRPEIAIGVSLAWYLLVFLFLYVTLATMRGSSFWPSLGWRNPLAAHSFVANPWICFFSGCCLAPCIAFLTARFHASGDGPAAENPLSALLFAGIALLIAPVVEETIFRGYLYPLFAKSFGVGSSIVLTGILFGIVHGPRLGWDWRVISTFTIVGLILTLVRAKSGTVVSSFCLHLGYNSVLVFAFIIATRGFTQFPPRP